MASSGLLHDLLALLLLLLLSPSGRLGCSAETVSGEAACEEKLLTQQQCSDVGCCRWAADLDECHSAVGAAACSGTGSGSGSSTDPDDVDVVLPGSGSFTNPDDIVLPTYGRGAVLHDWVDGTGMFASCGKTTTVFGVAVCVSPAAWKASQRKCNHIANVVLQLLDNDADGKADDTRVVRYMVGHQYYMVVPDTERDLETMRPPPRGVGQMTGVWEAVPNSCDTPGNRGASNTDRATWAAAVANTPGATGCDPNRDATTEEVFHLITHAAGKLWPHKWGPTETSAAGAAIFAMNGNCGWGYAGDFGDPSGSTPACTGLYAYDDHTCDVGCVVDEGIYWSSVAWMGGLMTDDRAAFASDEWQMTVPDASMRGVLPGGQANARTLEEGSPAMYALISDTTSEGHEWLPSIMPDGRYNVTAADAVASTGNTGNYDSGGAMPPASGTTTAMVVTLMCCSALAWFGHQ